MIHELLATGKENARTGKALAILLNCDVRDITQQIEKERREGQPICASSGDPAGYYLAEDEDELQNYCDRLKGRAIELFKTRQALVKTLQAIRAKKTP